MKLNNLFEADDPFAKYWNPAEREVERQKAAEKEDADFNARMMGGLKHLEQKAVDLERGQIKAGMNPDDSTLSRPDREPFETRQVRFQNGIYTVKAYNVDTYYGPETRAEFYTPDGKLCDSQQEAMSVGGLIRMWMEQGNHGPIRRRDETKF